MRTRTAAIQELVNANRPEARGAPLEFANENWPDVGYPAALPVTMPMMTRVAAVFPHAHRRALNRALREELDHGRRLLFVPVFLGAGAALWLTADTDPRPAMLVLAVSLLTGLALLNRYRRPVIAAVAGCLALVAAGAGLAALEAARVDTNLLDSPVTTDIRGLVLGRETAGATRYHYDVQLLSTANPRLERMPERVSLLARGEAVPVDIGAVIEGRARLTPPSGPAMPGLHDFAMGAYFSGTGANGFFYGAPRPSAGSDVPVDGMVQRFANGLHAARASIGDRIRTVIGGDAGAFAAALVTNEQRAISAPTIDALRLSGLAHIIAISGMNMALASGIFFVGLRSLLALSVGFAQSVPVKKIAAGGAILATTGYYMISGFAVSAERAYVMMVIILLAVLFDRPALSLRNIGLSAILILILSPSSVLGASLQMSYAGTLGLVAGYDYWSRRAAGKLPRGRGLPLPKSLTVLGRVAGGALLSSLVGGASTALFSAEHFQRISTYGLVANVLAEPLISFIVMPAGFVAMLAMPFGLDRWPLLLMGHGLNGVIAIGTWVAAWGGQWETGSLPAWFFSLCSIGFLLLTLLRTRLRLLGPAVIVLSGVALAVEPGSERPDVILSEDGRLAALVTDAGLAPSDLHPSTFLFGQWQRALRINGVLPPRILKASDAATDADLRIDDKRDRYRPLTPEEEVAERAYLQGTIDQVNGTGFICKRNAWCVAKLENGAVLAMLQNSVYTGVACDVASIVISNVPGFLSHCRSGALLITRNYLRQTGALTLQLTADAKAPLMRRSITNLARPWERYRLYDWRSRSYRSLEAPTPPPEDSGRTMANPEAGRAAEARRPAIQPGTIIDTLSRPGDPLSDSGE